MEGFGKQIALEVACRALLERAGLLGEGAVLGRVVSFERGEQLEGVAVVGPPELETDLVAGEARVRRGVAVVGSLVGQAPARFDPQKPDRGSLRRAGIAAVAGFEEPGRVLDAARKASAAGESWLIRIPQTYSCRPCGLRLHEPDEALDEVCPQCMQAYRPPCLAM
ncbi:hypothetical protein ACFOD9_12205 [Novosphingobium bradum]|uniref:Uncharacterized protein n=1 Tax=Novosphingobium bradum TaxID=1737444 RepID=A0ABV7IWB9_9SPHN